MSNLEKPLQLPDNDLRALNILSGDINIKWPQSKIKIFGSKIKGRADEESDLDVLINLPFQVDKETRRWIIHRVFEINLEYETNISVLIVSEEEWEKRHFSLLPIHGEVAAGSISL